MGAALSSQPKHWLPDREVPDDFGHRWVRIEPSPQLQVIRPRKSEARKEKAGLAHRPLIEILHIGRQRPALLVRNVRKHVFHCLSDAAAIWQFKFPKGVLSSGKDLAHGGHCVEIEQGVRVGLRARQLERKASVWRDLIWTNTEVNRFRQKLTSSVFPV